MDQRKETNSSECVIKLEIEEIKLENNTLDFIMPEILQEIKPETFPMDVCESKIEILEHTSCKQNNQGGQAVLPDIESQPPINQGSENNVEAKETEADSRSGNYVYNILMQSGEGKFLMKCFDYEQDPKHYKLLLEKKKKTYFNIHAVARLIVFHEINRTSSYTISPSRFETLAGIAASIFPGYMKERFYSRSTTKANANGAFQAYYSKLREKAIAIGETRPAAASRKRKLIDGQQHFTSDFEELKKVVPIIDEAYRRKWRTATQEKREFFAKFEIKTIIETFPNLRNPAGYLLIGEDFSAFFNKSPNMFSEKWPAIAPKIITLAKTKTSDKVVKEILKVNSKCLSDKDRSHLLALMLLPYLFNKIMKQTHRSKTGQNWAPEKSLVLSTFIYHLKESNNRIESFKKIQDELLKIHVDHNLTVQPYIVINGPTLDSITSSYVVIGDIVYQAPTILAAVDICFQSIKVLHDKFSHVSHHIWQFLEREIYGFDVPNIYACVASLIDKLRKF
ncbi:uncharacterized protein LOC117175232 isoform X2 [Belonocnema kinseyi]|uniref:uncharacterized protein LOC117175232 isoform X2 n=1 Tax=Belonocnema kinseyi TaxID=2817044 RepID=UPI00143D39AB|nr:uncharacterized protein LOC117175232 isoform X2 [Belonocnema kinseyi]